MQFTQSLLQLETFIMDTMTVPLQYCYFCSLQYISNYNAEFSTSTKNPWQIKGTHAGLAAGLEYSHERLNMQYGHVIKSGHNVQHSLYYSPN